MKTNVPYYAQPKYRPDIDGLRAISVFCVVVYHAFPKVMKGGFIGVDVFFVISGFLISTIIFEKLEKGTFSFSEFYGRRIRRIFPALILMFFLCFLFGWLCLLPDELNQLGKHILASAGFVSNLILWSEAGYFDNSAETKPLLHLWSLGIEEQFYIVWPFMLFLAKRFRINLSILTIFIACTSFAINVLMVNQYPVGTFYSPFSRFWELLCGSLLAWYSFCKSGFGSNNAESFNDISFSLKFKLFGIKRFIIDSKIYSFAGILLLLCGIFLINKNFVFPGYWALLPVLAAVLIIMAGPRSWINKNILSNKIFVWLGLISFPLYLWHWPLLSFGRILYSDLPPVKFRLIAIFVSIILAWLTVKYIERPFRFGFKNPRFPIFALSTALLSFGIGGYIVYKLNFYDTHNCAKLLLKRKGCEHIIGPSSAWFRGKEDWLFLGNLYNKNIEKIKLAIIPRDSEIHSFKNVVSKLVDIGLKYGAKTVLLVGPDKSTIYPEYLPDELIPSSTKYISFFLKSLKEINNLILYDPTQDLLAAKNSEGILYGMTDTHWNNKGAFVAFRGLAEKLNFSIPEVQFKEGSKYPGDLIEMSGLKNFPLHSHDNWEVIWNEKPIWTEKKIPNEEKTSFGYPSVVTNKNFLSSQYVWVVGDSFSLALKQYFNATFKEVRYIGHLIQKLSTLSEALDKAPKKPDLIVIIKVERSF